MSDSNPRRQVVLDTETTGLDPSKGHRLIEIGAVELDDRRLTEKQFHVYLNPERNVDPGAFKVHGLSDDFLADKPLFAMVVDDFMDFVSGAELVIHNAPFDLGFINHELRLLNHPAYPLQSHCSVVDTLVVAREKHPRQKNNLDALCKRYDVNNKDRTFHGALLDAQILSQVYLAMTGGQTSLFALSEQQPSSAHASQAHAVIFPGAENKVDAGVTVVTASEGERKAHVEMLASMNQALWSSSD